MRNWVKTALCLGVALQADAINAATPENAAPQEAPRPLLRPDRPGAGSGSGDDLTLAAVQVTPRPVARAAGTAPLQASRATNVAEATANSLLQDWIGDFRTRARAAGLSTATLDAAFKGVTYDAKAIKRDRNQSEFTKTIWDYLDSAASDARVTNGKSALAARQALLNRIEQTYGVDKEVVVAVWGLESNYGSYRGDDDIVQSLATLAFDGRRGAFFEAQLVAALKIIEAGDVDPRDMIGSWAGAMGHTQFIPTSYLDYAVDFTGDGKRDIWSDDPSDALASTAAYLKKFGWVTGQPWGVEVALPQGFDYRLANRKIQKSPADWAKLGVLDMDGAPVADHGAASILLPAGGKGAAFMIFRNFAVIERYNTADAYVIGVGHLSDRLKGGPRIKGDWPRGDRALTFAERQEMQRRLTRAGFNTQGVDGRIGPKTIAAIRDFQSAKGLVPDGYASLNLLKTLR
ncbi:membrane-bound lytic murein transglycosylase B precursor [Tritonibacter horizontis]|uniref:Membrane-bound lytic murein transglycosylase B n=2 Tax=Tritonibacter horizontis TaxID=1768241 RepID=A0A132C3T2_9RHOB|nr:lytic murein transglycosylase [Tritonibacter horizontis]KUP94730.1 membrane-bound lytic murein transglycosylase B precursor [Tritonibacter horizontis]